MSQGNTPSKCMGREEYRGQCQDCRRLPLTPKDEDAALWIEVPPLGDDWTCPKYKPRA
jgi:hypothetical protein